jgi:tRNA modification GTPase
MGKKAASMNMDKESPLRAASTIAAIATAVGVAGIGVIRISGPNAPAIAERIFKPKRALEPAEKGAQRWRPLPRRLHLGNIIDRQNGGAVIDEVLLALMPGPFSYTGEDVVEIQAHAGPIVMKKLLELVVKAGAELAEPGEFTRRAFQNGRIDLTQAEAIIDLIHARSEASLKIASRQVAGALKEKMGAIIQSLIDVLARAEAAIDFPDDCEETLGGEASRRRFQEGVISVLSDLLTDYDDGHLVREGMRLVILGKPNVGKSSLLNRLLKRERAIVTPVPGTTRDAIEEGFNIQGLPVLLVDTAGLRASTDPVEAMGMERTRCMAGDADVILLVLDARTGVTGEDLQIYEEIKDKVHLLVVNKIDLLEDGGLPAFSATWHKTPPVGISAKYDQNIGALKERIFELAMAQGLAPAEGIVPNLRQKGLIAAALRAARAAEEGLWEGALFQPELAAIDLKEALGALNEVIGKEARHDILDDIFSRFCIGK